MAGVNKVILLGNLGADPEVKHLENDLVLARLRIATGTAYRDKQGNRQERTEWHSVIFWRKLAEICEKYLHKGDQIYLEGSLQTRSYEQEGVTKYATEIVGSSLTMLSSRGVAPVSDSGANAASPSVPTQAGEQPIPDLVDDDLPF